MSIHQRSPNEVCESPPIPPGFRFCPTGEELVSCYLTPKVLDSNVVFQAIGDVDFNKCEPWDLAAKANVGNQKEFYFFSRRGRRYPTGLRTNRATEAGYWKATGKDREVKAKSSGRKLGMKKTLVFYKGRAPKDEKTNWIMHEYRLESEFKPDQQEWVVCRVCEKNVSSKMTPPESSNIGWNGEDSTDPPCPFESRFELDLPDPLPDLISVYDGEPSTDFLCPFEPALPPALSDLTPPESYNLGWNGEDSTDPPYPFEPRFELDLPDPLPDLISVYDGEPSTDFLCPFEPALPPALSDFISFNAGYDGEYSTDLLCPFEPLQFTFGTSVLNIN